MNIMDRASRWTIGYQLHISKLGLMPKVEATSRGGANNEHC